MTSKSVRTSAGNRKRSKPAKPHPDFPLTPHARGCFCKTVRGKVYYFPADPIEALREWNAIKDDLLEGRDPRKEPKPGESLGWLCNAFMDSRQARVDSGELTERSKGDYYATCQRLLKFFGKSRRVDSLGPKDFGPLKSSYASRWASPVTVKNEIGRVRVLLKFAYDIEAIARPIRIGPDFGRPSKKALRLHRKSRPQKLLSAEQIHALLAVADVHVAAMVMLGINAAYNNRDCGLLELGWVDFDRQWLAEMRSKTAVDRECWLWLETIAALQASIAARNEPKDIEHADRVFITKYGGSWAKDGRNNPLSQRMKVYLREIGIDLAGVNFGSLRHTFQTVAGGSKDQIAVDRVFGHVDERISGDYREDIDPQRVKDVCSFVRDWFLAGGDA